MTQLSNLHRFSLEALVIVASILLAFAIDAWWDGILEGRQEAEALLGLREEFNANLIALNTAIENVRERQQVVVAVLDLTQTRIDDRESESAIEFLARLIASSEISFLPADGTLSYLTGSQGIGIISSEALRLQLISWPRLIAGIEDRQLRSRELMRQYLMPYLWVRVPTTALDAIAATGSTEQIESYDIEGIDVAGVYSDLQFANIINELRYAYSVHAERLESSRAEVELTLQLIGNEIQ